MKRIMEPERNQWYDRYIKEVPIGKENVKTKREIWAKVERVHDDKDPPSYKWFNYTVSKHFSPYVVSKQIPVVWCTGNFGGHYIADSAEELALWREQFAKPQLYGHEQAYNNKNTGFFPLFRESAPQLHSVTDKNDGIIKRVLSATGIMR